MAEVPIEITVRVYPTRVVIEAGTARVEIGNEDPAYPELEKVRDAFRAFLLGELGRLAKGGAP